MSAKHFYTFSLTIAYDGKMSSFHLNLFCFCVQDRSRGLQVVGVIYIAIFLAGLILTFNIDIYIYTHIYIWLIEHFYLLLLTLRTNNLECFSNDKTLKTFFIHILTFLGQIILSVYIYII